ncbi:MAG: hypothetical protein WBN72_11585 [Nitrososphaeraceae archaeon]
MSKFTYAEKALVKTIIASLTIKRIPESEIQNEIYRQTNKTITKTGLFRIKQTIKQESAKWYKVMRENEYEYIHQFKERIDEILWLQRKHHEIIASDKESTSNKQSSLAELHKLNITLSNYFDVAPTIVNGITLPESVQSKTTRRKDEDIIV